MDIAKHQIFCGRRFSELDGYKQPLVLIILLKFVLLPFVSCIWST